MLTSEQLAMRRTGITSTDITRIVGESPFGGPADVYLEKVLEEPVDDKPTIAQRIGNHLEPLVLELIAEQFGIEVAGATTMRHPVHSWAMSTPDGLVSGGFRPGGTAEAKVKTVLFHDRDLWHNEKATPPFVHVQVQWQQIVACCPVSYVGALIGAKPLFWIVENDDALAGALLDSGQAFHERHVLPRRPPPPDGSEGARRMLKAVWPRARKATALKASRQAELLASEYLEAHRAVKLAEDIKERAAQELIVIAEDFERVDGDGWRLLRGERKGYSVAAHEVAPGRMFDLRKVQGR